jgi:hypothetical protein
MDKPNVVTTTGYHHGWYKNISKLTFSDQNQLKMDGIQWNLDGSDDEPEEGFLEGYTGTTKGKGVKNYF